MPRFSQGTKDLGAAIVLATEGGAFSLVGGGDSVAAAKQFELDERVSYVSTGGGAMLEYLEGQGAAWYSGNTRLKLNWECSLGRFVLKRRLIGLKREA